MIETCMELWVVLLNHSVGAVQKLGHFHECCLTNCLMKNLFPISPWGEKWIWGKWEGMLLFQQARSCWYRTCFLINHKWFPSQKRLDATGFCKQLITSCLVLMKWHLPVNKDKYFFSCRLFHLWKVQLSSYQVSVTRCQ